MMKRITAGLLALTIAASTSAVVYADSSTVINAAPEMTSYSELNDVAVRRAAQGVSDAPEFTTTKITDNGALIEWEKVTGIDGYLLYRYGGKNGYSHQILSADTTSFVWEDFDEDATYGLLTYINVDGDTIKSPAVEKKGTDFDKEGQTTETQPEVKAPDTPKYSRAGRGRTAVRLYWEALECDGVEVIQSEGSEWKIAGTAAKGAADCRIEGLIPGTAYYFKLRAFNLKADGTKVYSEESDLITVTTTGTAPVTVTAPNTPKYLRSGRGKTAVRLYWEALECDGVTVKMLGENGQWKVCGDAKKGETNFRIEGLAPGTEYKFIIAAFNKKPDGTPVYSNDSGIITVTTTGTPAVKAPAVPKYLKTGRGKTALRLYWETLECDGVEVQMKTNDGWKVAGTSAKGATNYRIGGLTQGTPYEFKMRAFNLKPDGTKVYSDFTDVIKAQTTGVAPLAKPDKVTITGIGKSTNSVRVYWQAQKCSGYEIYIYKDNKWYYVGNASGDETNYRIDGLTPDTVYYVTVRAFNTDGKNTVFGDYSANKKVTTVKAKTVTPPPVVNVTKISKGKTAVRLRWDKLDCDGYEVYRQVGGTYVLASTLGKDADNVRYEGLTPNTAYYFRIRAFRLNGDGSKVFGEFGKNYKATTLADTSSPKIEVKNGVTYVDGILIANKTYSLPASYNPGGLTAETSAAFAKLQQAAKKDGIYLWCASGFRSYAYQQTLYNNYVARDGKAAADTYSARPGHSEHQTGLALDVNNPSTSFNNTNEARWLAAHCAEYGFILRYPNGKQGSTGFMYESWHIRYLGTDLAVKVTASGKTLEEYLGITSVYNY